MKSVNLQANAPLTGVKYKVERHDRGASAPNAADLAAVEHAKQAATRQAQRSQLERFNHELELRVERSERAKREEEKKLAAIRVAKARTDLAAANERARAPFKLEVAAAAVPAWPASQEHGTQLSLQRQILQDAGQRAIQMMMQLYQPDEEQPDEAAARYIAVPQLASPEQGAPEKAASERGTVRVLQAAADRAVAHDRRIQLEEYAVHKKRATQAPLLPSLTLEPSTCSQLGPQAYQPCPQAHPPELHRRVSSDWGRRVARTGGAQGRRVAPGAHECAAGGGEGPGRGAAGGAHGLHVTRAGGGAQRAAASGAGPSPAPRVPSNTLTLSGSIQQSGAGPEPPSAPRRPHHDCTCRAGVPTPRALLHTRSASDGAGEADRAVYRGAPATTQARGILTMA